MRKKKKHDMIDAGSLEALPDYAALRQVKDALWKIGDVHGAAVMVGAGFSRFAKLAAATTPQPPLWHTFSDAMLDELYPRGGGPSDPLVLAEEYRATLGHDALEGIIRRYVRDAEWQPSVLHDNLLRLPWADVLTTNWDTLLERSAGSNPDVSYDTVRVTTDIARARRPRIVKLHGSMPSHLPFIFTEEDFRTYPERFAPFVNLAQQALLENELCLLGFSGEDPNFLKWAGWVRDQLGTSARPIRLIGVLNIAPSRRRLFEARNISPVDLFPLVQHLPNNDQHRHASKILLDYLWQARPSANVEWQWLNEKELESPSSSEIDAKVSHLTHVWRVDREKHPGWLVTPFHDRYIKRFGIHDSHHVILNELPKTSPTIRAIFIFEAVWRWCTLFWSLPLPLEEIAEQVLKSDEDSVLPQDHRVFLHMTLLRSARHRRDWTAFEIRLERLKSLNTEEARAAHAYEGCLRARDVIDYQHISENVHLVDGQDAVWGLRRAALLSEILETQTASKTVQATFEEIRRRRSQDRRSLWLLSREAWASLMMRTASFELRNAASEFERQDWPLTYKAAKADPWDELSDISEMLVETETKMRAREIEKKPLFDPGRYIQGSGVHLVNNAVSSPYEQLAFLAELVGLPLQLGSAEVIGRRWARAIGTIDQGGSLPAWLALRAIAVHDYELLEEYFSRISVARLPIDDVELMVDRLRGAIAYGRAQMGQNDKKTADWSSRLSTLCELLSRLCVRLRGDRAIECFRLGASLLSDPAIRHWWALKGISSLLTRSIQALEPDRRREIALEVLCLPLPNEMKFVGPGRDQPEASELLKARDWKAREDSYGWNSRIAHLLEQSQSVDSESRRHAIFRLLRLYEAAVLTGVEQEKFGQGLWFGATPEQAIAETRLLPHVLLRLPSPSPEIPKEAFAKLVVRVAKASFDENSLNSLHGASFTLKGLYSRYPLQSADADVILTNLLQWTSKPLRHTGLFDSDVRYENESTEYAIARVLSSTVLPAVSIEALDDSTCSRLFSRISDGSMPSLLIALPTLIKRKPELADRAHKAIRVGLLAGNAQSVHAALNAMFIFVGDEAGELVKIPDSLVSEVVTLCFMRREPGLVSALAVANKMLKAAVMPAHERDRLADGIELIYAETSYKDWKDKARNSNVGLIRRGAVQLCQSLKDTGGTARILDQWLSEVETDPMPEVRYALKVQGEDE